MNRIMASTAPLKPRKRNDDRIQKPRLRLHQLLASRSFKLIYEAGAQLHKALPTQKPVVRARPDGNGRMQNCS